MKSQLAAYFVILEELLDMCWYLGGGFVHYGRAIGQFMAFGWGFCPLGTSYWTVYDVGMRFLSIREVLLDSL
ncbi:hypothetical protein BME96_06475 [Virgibacillus halodenitrificans]|uniref:Uncharacterized protein n=1 Tax=Virgibacillus halodenitrificans TaxID=1482 RepID=A0AAC9IXL7_VIRHA|nr:hypothetical protein [Virgibacillus halodenitrificans]APC47836.1 hypothetical protein BME96_06475 [Virgibacillus halodenitrificans]